LIWSIVTAKVFQYNALSFFILSPLSLDYFLHLEYNDTVRGPLHGVPILIKDNIATFDKMNNTAGSYALLGYYNDILYMKVLESTTRNDI
jgi:hypothetical protein